MNDTSAKSNLPDPHQWERGWKAHEDMQLQRLARLPLADKLAWLEQTHQLVMQLGGAKSVG